MATYEKKLGVGSLIAGADLSTKNHYLAKVDTSAENQLVLAGAGELVAGVIGNKPAAGEPVELDVGIILQVVAGAAVSVGDELTPDSAGKAVTAVTGNRTFGQALEAATADGQEIRVLMTPGETVPA